MPIARTQPQRVNEQIRISPIRLIDANNDQLGVVPTDEAQRRAREQGLDLVEVAPLESPPVCRIMDYGKFKYQQRKKQRERIKHEVQLKEIRLRPKTDDNDRQIKVNRARRFIEEGHKVQFTMLFRGRERSHQEIGRSIFEQIIIQLVEIAKVERPPRMEGSRMVVLFTPQGKR